MSSSGAGRTLHLAAFQPRGIQCWVFLGSIATDGGGARRGVDEEGEEGVEGEEGEDEGMKG